MKVAIIGAGAAGCFCAAHLHSLCPEAEIDMFERGSKPLQKVAITGGGRCNLTNSFAEVKSLQQVYPRGANLMKRLFRQFGPEQTMQWFEAQGVRLVTQPDQCVFPRSQDTMEVVSTLLRSMQGVHIYCNHRIDSLPKGYNYTVITTGGSPQASGLSFLDPLELELVPPVPSLFTFNIGRKSPDAPPVTELMGVVVERVTATLAGAKFKAEGPLLITHWGMSGPAILKLSSHGARYLAEHDYRASLCVNWMGTMNEEEVHQLLTQLLDANRQKQISNLRIAATDYKANESLFSQRIWNYLLLLAGIAPERRCAEVGSKQLRRLCSVLTADVYPITGQSRFKEEFVTCGGVALSNVDPQTLECRRHPGIYLAGEVLDVDAVTGGFNLQAAWTMGCVVARSIAASSAHAKAE